MTDQTQNHFLLRHENLSLKFLIRIIWNIKFQGGGKNSIPVFLFEQSDISSIMLWVLFSTHDRCPFWLIHVAVLNAQKSVTCHSRNNRSIGTRTEGNLTCMELLTVFRKNERTDGKKRLGSECERPWIPNTVVWPSWKQWKSWASDRVKRQGKINIEGDD